MNKLFSLLLGLVLLSSCDSGSVYEEYVKIPEHGWNADSIIDFRVEILDTNSRYDINILLRNDEQYPFRNLFFFRSVLSDRGTEFADTVEYQLADAYGKWLGSGVGAIKTHEWPFRNSSLRFRKAGVYTFRLQQAMREEQLPGVIAVGLSVSISDEEENN